MTREIVVALVALGLLGILAGVLAAWHSRAPATGPRLHCWAVATATTRDGVTAHLQVEYSWTPLADGDGPLADRVAAGVEDALRALIAERNLAALPGLGDDPGWGATSLVPGVRLDHVSVTGSEVEVTGELRRLVQDRGTG